MISVAVGNREIQIKKLGAVQFMDIMAEVSRRQYMKQARDLAESLSTKEKVAVLNQALKDSMVLDEQMMVSGATVEGQAALLAAATDLSPEEAKKILLEATSLEQEEIMLAVRPEAGNEGDEKETALRDAVEELIEVRKVGNKSDLEEAVKAVSDALRSAACLVPAGNE